MNHDSRCSGPARHLPMRHASVWYLPTLSLLAFMFAMFSYVARSSALPYVHRKMVLNAGSLRFDGGPSDFALQNSGFIGNHRGFRIQRGDALTDTSFGIGLSYGITSAIEVGALIANMAVTPSARWQNNSLYCRYVFLGLRRQQIAAQVTFIRPEIGDYGFGVAIPILLQVGQHGRIDTGIEVETIHEVAGVDNDHSTTVSIDAPIAFNYNLSDRFFSGIRSGLFIFDNGFKRTRFPLGVQGGYVMAEGDLDILISFSLERFIELGSRNPFHIREFLFNVGLSYRFDILD